MFHLRLPGNFTAIVLAAGLILGIPTQITKLISTANAAEDAENVLVMELKNGETFR